METLLIALRRRGTIPERGLTDNQVLVASFLIIAGLMVVGLIVLRAIDYFRNRVNKFQPLLDPAVDDWDRLGPLASLELAFVAGTFTGFAIDPGSGVIAFILAVVIILVLGRYAFDHQRRLAAIICGETSCALRYKLPLDQFLATLAIERNSKGALKAIAARLRAGMRLSDALAESNLLPIDAIVAIRAAERNGGVALEAVLQNLSLQISRDQLAFARVLNYVYTPLLGWAFALLIGYWTCSLTLMRILDCAIGVGQARAFRTFLVQALRYLQYSSAIAVMFSGASLLYIAFNPDVLQILAELRDQLADRLPLLGARKRHRSLARTCETLYSLMVNNVPLWTALREVSDYKISGAYAGELKRVGAELQMGREFDPVIRNSSLPDSVKSLLIAGARGGTLPDAFAAAAEWHDSRARKLDHVLFTIIPCITIPLAGLVIGLIYGTVFLLLTQIREAVTLVPGILH